METSFPSSNEVLRLTRNGIWMSDETVIEHARTLEAFAKNLQRDDEGYFIRIGWETKRVVVEDTPYFVLAFRLEKNGEFTLSLNDGSRETLGTSTLRYQPGRLTCQVKDGAYEARFLRAPYHALLEFLEEDSLGYYLRLPKATIRL